MECLLLVVCVTFLHSYFVVMTTTSTIYQLFTDLIHPFFDFLEEPSRVRHQTVLILTIYMDPLTCLIFDPPEENGSYRQTNNPKEREDSLDFAIRSMVQCAFKT